MTDEKVVESEGTGIDQLTLKKPKATKKNGGVRKLDVIMMMASIVRGEVLRKAKVPLPHKFHLLRDAVGKVIYLEEGEAQVVRRVDIDWIIDTLTDYFCTHFASYTDYDLDDSFFSRGAKNWKARTKSFAPQILPIRQLSEEGYCWHRLGFDFKQGQHPLWDELLGRMSNAEAFKAWVGSLFDPKADKQTYLWMHGDGGDGKGSIARFLHHLIGPAVSFEQTPENDKFWTFGLLGKRLVVFGDCNNSSFPMTGLFKSLTGLDPMRVEQKGKQSFTAKLDCMFMFLSNELPNLTSKKCDTRRCILVEFKPVTNRYIGDYEEALKREAQAFLWTCQVAYRKACPNHEALLADIEKIEEIANFSEEPYEVIWRRNFTQASKITNRNLTAVELEFVDPLVMQEVMMREGLNDNFKKSKFKDWMLRQYGVERKQVKDSHGKVLWRYLGVRELNKHEKESSIAVYADYNKRMQEKSKLSLLS